MFNCNFKCSCTLAAVIASIVIGIVTVFLQITGAITAAPAFLWATLGTAAVYLAVLTLSAGVYDSGSKNCCLCPALGTVLAGILGTILLSVILLAVGIVATSILSAILLGVLLFFFSLTVTGTACLVRCLFGCSE